MASVEMKASKLHKIIIDLDNENIDVIIKQPKTEKGLENAKRLKKILDEVSIEKI
jgi:hypothetical protein